ncbi:MAG: SUMF1/EgtB/PvdO family nonheme iron enzyme [Akkermansiaceae bacterium]|nr:SUMF1/EgtB/PvdO family nonheme iron enzyme [Akkermansiaceae bacterium]
MPLSRTTSGGPGASRRPRMRRDLRPDVPDHEILRLIGNGAYGEVWLARSVTGAFRAVKVVWREDFEDEATYVREFESILHYEPVARGIPGVVHILHVGQSTGDFPYYYYVMELADDAYTGIYIDPLSYVPRTLQSVMELYTHNPMPLDYVLEVGSQLAHALDGLHAADLTHRDVKPSNIVFVNSCAKLADAGSVARGGGNRSFVGTQGYTPPEGAGTPRADVYALAKVLYEMSTGKDRLDFPELPTSIPDPSSHRRWLAFNEIICAAAEPLVNKESIVTAQDFADRLDSLRHYAPGHRSRGGEAAPRRWWVWPLFGLSCAAVLFTGWFFLPQGLRTRLGNAYQALFAARDDSAPAHSQLFISSVPAGASIYTEDGRYVDETPYGPVDVQPGRELSFILRKDGYADYEVRGKVPRQDILALGGHLRPYRPPRQHTDWQDALGTTYKPTGATHRAVSPVTLRQFETFLHSDTSVGNIPYEQIPGTELVRTTFAGISAYTLWLTRLCMNQGFIGRDHSLAAIPEDGTASGTDMCAYRLTTKQVQKTPITLHSHPTGATVLLNGRPIGITPLQGVRVPLAPYFLEIRKPGYATERFSGLSTKDLSINVQLKPNNSVSFDTEWVNSLGLSFRPFRPSLMVGATEVRVSDYHAFVAATGAPTPPPTDFVQSGDHPVVCVSRSDAESFATWLTAQEREAGLIGPTDEYRLPTDEEWSLLVGLKDEKGRTPYERQQYHRASATPEFPWGLSWPPPARFGNYSDSSALHYVSRQYVLESYTDGFPFSAPVRSFAPNSMGFYDLSGNVQEWVSDEYGGPPGFSFRRYGVTRGGDYTSFRPSQLSSGSRTPRPENDRNPTVGFRLILERTPRQF